MTQKVLFALPCYNEAQNIPALLGQFVRLHELYKNSYEIEVVVIDDCSKDSTQEVIKPFLSKYSFIKSIKHEVNKGLTGGINTSFDLFKKEVDANPDIICCGLMDGDNSHNPMTIPDMVSKILQGHDVVVASRYRPGARILGVSFIRQILSLGLALLFKFIRNIPGVRDYSCGYRVYSPSIIKEVKKTYPQDVVFEKSFASMVEILVKCHLAGAICTEVPFVLRYDLKLGHSKMPFKKTIMGNFKLLLTLKKYWAPA
ncbi:MAG: glycosyltransferase family 2 protein [Flammeovirgaceae bacterium]